MCFSIAAVVTLGDQAFFWIRDGLWPSLIVGYIWPLSELRSLVVDSDNARRFIDWILDVPLSEGLFVLAGFLVCIGGALFVRRGV
jgi:hypothetical protein